MLADLPIEEINAILKKQCDEKYPKEGDYNNETAYNWYYLDKPEPIGFFHTVHLDALLSNRMFKVGWKIINDMEWFFEENISMLDSVDDRLKAFREAAERGSDLKQKYGVADNIQQVLDNFPELITSEKLYVVEYHTLTPKDSPGWRWHKNGHYYGKQKSSYEHLGEETEVTEIISFHIHEIVEDK